MTVLSVIERFLGFVYRIYLSRTIYSEGLGIYQITLTIFGLLLTITSSGIPITVSRMMTRYNAEGNSDYAMRTISAGLIFSLSLAIPITLVFIFFHDHLSFVFSDERCMEILLIIIPGLIFTSIYAVIRGSFWGNRDFLPYSIIELLEEAIMLVAGIALINFSTSMMDGVRRAGWAVLISYIFSFTTATCVFLIKGGRFKKPLKTLKPLVISSAPITGMRTATSLINSLIAVILPARLIASGLSGSEAVAQFGTAFGMAIPILFMPGTLIGSLAVVLVPELSESFYKKQTATLKINVERALKFSIFIACAIIPVLISYGKNLGMFFYNSTDAGIYLAYAAVAMLPMSVNMITTSMLNSMNMEKRTLLYYLCGAAFMLLSVFFLPKYLGIYSLIVGLFGQFFITAILNLAALEKKLTVKLDYSKFAAKSIIFTIPSCLLGVMLNNIISHYAGNTANCIIGCIAVVLFNIALYVVFGMIDIKNPKHIN